MFNKKKKSILQSIQLLCATLQDRLKNKELLDYFIEKIYYGNEINGIKYVNETGIYIIDPKTQDTFLLSIEDNKIRSEYTCWEGRHTEKKTCIFEEDRIIVHDLQTSKVVLSNSDKLLSVERHESTKIYNSNELTYSNQFDSETHLDEHDYNSYSQQTETYINSKKEAVVKTTSVGDLESLYDTKTTYSKTNNYDVPPFNTHENNRGIYMFGMEYCTKEEYDEFLKTIQYKPDIAILRMRK